MQVVRHGTSWPPRTRRHVVARLRRLPRARGRQDGTAEVVGKGDYSWYVSFAPTDHPKYVVAVMIEQGGHGGSAAAPAARLIYDALFDVHGGTLQGARERLTVDLRAYLRHLDYVVLATVLSR